MPNYMGLFSKADREVAEYKYSPQYWGLFKSHIKWLEYQEEQRNAKAYRASIGCSSDGRSSKWCAHCRLNDRDEGCRRREPSSTKNNKKWNAGLPFSRAFKNSSDIQAPKYGARITKYEAAMARHCDVPYRYVIDLTRGNVDTRALTMNEILEEAKTNTNYKKLVIAIMEKRFKKRVIFEEEQVTRVAREFNPTVEDDFTGEFFVKTPRMKEPKITVVPADSTKEAPLGLRRELASKCKFSVEYLLYKQQYSIKTIRQVLRRFDKKARDIFLSYKGKAFLEIVKEERIKKWTTAVDKVAKTPEQAATWKALYWLKPIKEIIIIEKHLGNFTSNANMSEFTRKVRYFKDGGVIARATPGKTLDEVIAKRRFDKNKENVDRFFQNTTYSKKYSGKTVTEIKLALLQEKYPVIEKTGDLTEMKEKIKQLREHETLNLLKTRYPAHVVEGKNYTEAIAAVNDYKESIEYSVNAYFKDNGITAKKYPGKPVPEIKAARKEARIARSLARPQRNMDIYRGSFERNAPVEWGIYYNGKRAVAEKEEIQEEAKEQIPIEEVVWTPLPQPKMETRVHEALKLQTPVLDTERKTPFELKTVIKHHIGSVPLRNTRKQLIQSYSKDMKASAGFARISASRYPEKFRDNVRALKPELGKAYKYQTVSGSEDMCIITKINSTDRTSSLQDVKSALQDLSRQCNKSVMMPRIETGCN